MEGPGRDGLDLSRGATWLVREYSNWHFDGQGGSVDSTSRETRGFGVGSIQKLETEASLVLLLV